MIDKPAFLQGLVVFRSNTTLNLAVLEAVALHYHIMKTSNAPVTFVFSLYNMYMTCSNFYNNKYANNVKHQKNRQRPHNIT